MLVNVVENRTDSGTPALLQIPFGGASTADESQVLIYRGWLLVEEKFLYTLLMLSEMFSLIHQAVADCV